MVSTVAEKVDKQFGKYPSRVYPKGQILIFANEDPEYIFYITKGRVIKYDISYRGDEVVVNIFKAPAFFPMSWAINRLPNKYFYKADEITEVHTISVDEALIFLRENPDVMYDLLARIYQGMEGMLSRLVQLMSGTAKSRLVQELIIECRRFGEKQADGSCKLTISEQSLAARVGLSRETVSREIRKLKDRGLVHLQKHHIIINNVSALEAILATES
jgi:CRP/FNR family transcriptional regulator, cyclic AMP receptor protein